jgi:integrase
VRGSATGSDIFGGGDTGREINRLSPGKVRTAKAGRHADGGGLLLQVTPGASGLSKSWIFRYALHGRERFAGLGPLHTVSLSEAREKARAMRQQLLDGVDPLEAKEARIMEQRLASTRALTFKQAAQQYIDSHDAGWRSAKHRREWADTLNAYAFPIIGSLPVQAVNVDLVLQVLRPIWQTKTETASRVRGRIELVLDLAKARGLREGDNPADWATLKHLLPPRSKVHRKQHFEALPYTEVGAFMAGLRKLDGAPARALEFLVLTAARFGEVRGAVWDEVDGDVWTIPAARTKAHREHRIPLCRRAAEIIAEMRALQQSDLIFPGRSGHAPLGQMSLLQVIERLGRKGVTAHGFRSTFRDWCGARTNFPREVAELALAHRIGDAAEQAYARDDLFQKRRKLMEAWGAFCSTPQIGGKVLTMQRA